MENDRKFSNGCMFPGNQNGPPEEIYNCRCTRIAAVDGVDTSDAKCRARDPETGEVKVIEDMTYSEWAGWKENTDKTVDISSKSAKIREKTADGGGTTMQTIGKIDIEKYKCITPDITTDEVIITDERIEHIRERHPNDYERFVSYIPQIIADPDYIVEGNKEHTGVLLREFRDKNEKFKLILRLKIQGDPEQYKNSVLSFWHIGDTTWNKTIKIKKILYKKE